MENAKKKPIRTITVSTDLFKDKVVPPFLRDHTLFRNPTNIQKIFPSIGLPNFCDKVNIEKSFVDIKKENGYIHLLLRTISDIIVKAKTSMSEHADRLQFLATSEERAASRGKLTELYDVAGLLGKLIPLTDPYEAGVLDNTIQIIEGKVALKLPIDVMDSNDKAIFRKGEPIFRVLHKIKEKCAALDVPIVNYEQTEAFKIFSRENMPNKEFSIIFSSEGEQGAWDIATMSMRGIKSCQRWDGEYPRCLIGSIFSKFVGIIYLTSGVPSETNGVYKDLGSKMIRRCVIRYAVDTDEGKPCILMDKMYPENDKDVIAFFIKSISQRTQLPVYYAPEIGNKTKHIYLPSEKTREKISDRDWSYQDTPLKTKNDMNIYVLASSKEELEREIKGFAINLPLFLARRMEAIHNESILTSEEIKKTIANIRMNTSFAVFSTQIASWVLSAFKFDNKGHLDSKRFYREYLLNFLRNRTSIRHNSETNILSVIQQNTSRTIDKNIVIDFIFTSMIEFVKSEVRKVGN